MAVQYHVAFSRQVMGAGIIAGIPQISIDDLTAKVDLTGVLMRM